MAVTEVTAIFFIESRRFLCYIVGEQEKGGENVKYIQNIQIRSSNSEEILPDFSEDFPYLATYAEYDSFLQPNVPWHWHNSLELFYIEKGGLTYSTPSGSLFFPEGSGGLVNSGVLHTSRWEPAPGGNIQFLHFFDPELLSGKANSQMDQKYIRPLVHQSGIEILPLYPQQHGALLRRIREAFDISETAFGYEFQIRRELCDIWLQLLEIAKDRPRDAATGSRSGEQVKRMMVYVHEHYGEHISVTDLAETAHLSKRACFRVFQEYLHMTPVEYIKSYRLQIACQLLAEEKYSITEIAYRCGMGSSSYFGKVFREEKGCTPLEYRRYWHDNNK